MEAGQPPGGAAFGSARWRSAPGTARREQPPSFLAVAEEDGSCHANCVGGRIRGARSVGRFRSFSKNSNERRGKYLEPNTPKLKMLMLHSLKKKPMFDPRSCLLVSRFPSFQSFSPPTATFTFRKKNSSNQVTSLILFTIGRRRGKRLI